MTPPTPPRRDCPGGFRDRACSTGELPQLYLAGGEAAANLVQGVAGEAGKTVFVFPGQGPQWAGMAVERPRPPG
jgi:acyl transferase domain-containing protein